MSQIPVVLPPEIWSTIFLATCGPPQPTRFLDLGDHQRLLNILRLTHVCRYWRSIAHSTTQLWNAIVFNPLLDIETENHLATLCLEKSANSPLYVHLFCPPIFGTDDDDDEPEGLEENGVIREGQGGMAVSRMHSQIAHALSTGSPSFHSFMKTTSRWKALIITTQTDWFEPFFTFFASLAVDSPKFPNLCNLKLQTTDYKVWEIIGTPANMGAFMEAPNLTHVAVSELPSNPLLLPLPLDRLTTLQISNPCSVLSALNLLKACPSLQSFRAAVEQLDDIEPVSDSIHVEHNALRSLVLFSTEEGLDTLMLHLTLHSLRELDIDSCDAWPGRTIKPFLSSSADVIQDLTIHAPDMTTAMLLDCLQVVPALKHLTVEQMCDPSIGSLSQLFKRLTRMKDSEHGLASTLLPSLQSINLVYFIPLYCGWRGEPINFKAFQDMALSRWTGGDADLRWRPKEKDWKWT
ncbi:hypothetical protein VNI00_002267 [Paramarasmius palmivorus]|uniref:F-box domain-containing protein n=1 Tax=Paramarasmius palmivorus TaxID=297713 RepID=A0AAW0E0I5_9AGAR